MYIRRLEIENLRGFAKLDLEFRRPDDSFAGWTVIAGRNGSGKTTLLKAAALSMMSDAWSLQGQWAADWLRAGAAAGHARAHLVPSETDETSLRGGTTGAPFTQTFVVQQSGPTMESNPPFSGPAFGLRGWLLAGYGAFRRISGHAADDEIRMGINTRLGGLVTLFSEGASLAESIQWLKDVNHRVLEEKNGSRPKHGAVEFEAGVHALLNDGLLPDRWKIQGVDADGVWTIRDGLRLPLRELGEGLRTTTSLVIDILKQIHRAFGSLALERKGEQTIVDNDGIILIDEPEAHLHVSWQQKIGFWLKRHFPRIQFIVTTHSPFICQAADPYGLIRLASSGDDEPSGRVSDELHNTVVNGDVDDAVMSALFGLDQTHSEQAETLRSDVARLQVRVIRGLATTEEEERLRELSARLPRTGAAIVDQALRKLQVTR